MIEMHCIATLLKTRQAFLTGLCIDSHTLTAIVGHSLTSTIWYNTVETNRMLRKVSIRHGSKLERKEREYMLHDRPSASIFLQSLK